MARLWRLRRAAAGALLASAALLQLTQLAGCASPASDGSLPREGDAARPAPAAQGPAATTAPASPATTAPGSAGAARWVQAHWADLPSWPEDRSLELWPALQASCQKPQGVWRDACARLLQDKPPDDAAARRALQRWLQPWRLETRSGQVEGLATGYFEPLLRAQRQPQPGFGVALHTPPADLAARRPHWSRQELDTLPAAQAALRGREIAFIEDPIDLMLLQIQGSGRLQITEPDGRQTLLRVAFAGHNGHSYRSPGRWLIDQGALRPDAASWSTIRAWALQNPQRLQELMWSNPRVVYFRAEPLPDPNQGPRGAQGVPLTPGRSVAVDPLAVPYGTPMWVATSDPANGAPLRRLMMAQDTGGAILGAVRVDYFWGWGEQALAQASRMKQPLRAWALWPLGLTPPGAVTASD